MNLEDFLHFLTLSAIILILGVVDLYVYVLIIDQDWWIWYGSSEQGQSKHFSFVLTQEKKEKDTKKHQQFLDNKFFMFLM